MYTGQQHPKIEHANHSAREKGDLTAREFKRVVTTFNSVLQFKEKIRPSLDEKLENLKSTSRENNRGLQTLRRNVEIYDANINKIAEKLEDLRRQEEAVREEYESLLRGSAVDSLEVDEELSCEGLIQRRNEYLAELNNQFKKLETVLYHIDKLRN